MKPLKESDQHIGWARVFWAAMQPFSAGGVYINFLSNEGEERVQAAYDSRTYERLVSLKKMYEPDEFFPPQPEYQAHDISVNPNFKLFDPFSQLPKALDPTLLQWYA